MALINFDCPECGHNLEVDEGGAGFIIKCPECDSPLQIPELPKSRKLLKTFAVLVVLLAFAALAAAVLYQRNQMESMRTEWAEMAVASDQLLQQTQAALIQQVAETDRWEKAAEAAKLSTDRELAGAALTAMDTADHLAAELIQTTQLLLDASPNERTRLLRQHMKQRVEAAKNSLPAQPAITDVAPDRGIQGRQIIFPLLPSPDGTPLRENAEVTGVEHDRISFRFPGGTASYRLTELHPGVAAFLPVDPLLTLPKAQWTAETKRVQHTRDARRTEDLAALRATIETLLAEESP